MALMDDVKVALRISSDAYDSEVLMLIDAAIADMRRVGIKEELLNTASLGALAKQAIYCYVKSNFGFDNPEAERINLSYRQTVIDLMNSSKAVGL